MDFILIILLIILTYITGSIIEKKHFKKIIKREKALIKKPMISYGRKYSGKNKKIKKVELVTGETVISGDYFKNFAAGLKNFFGGRLTSFESVMDRGRREAVLRMREKAKGASIIVNTRVESVMLNDIYKGSVPQCAIIAYGTAITYER